VGLSLNRRCLQKGTLPEEGSLDLSRRRRKKKLATVKRSPLIPEEAHREPVGKIDLWLSLPGKGERKKFAKSTKRKRPPKDFP